MLILYEGRASVLVDGHQVAEKHANDVVGETALQTKQKRKAAVKAYQRCRCLYITKDDYDVAIDLFKTLQKHKIYSVLQQTSWLSKWNLYKIKAFS